MTTKKKTTTKAKTEPAAVTKTVKASKKAAPQPTVKVIATMPELQEGPVAPTVAAAMAAKAEAVVAEAAAPAPAKEKQVLTVGMFQKALYEKGFYGGHWDGHYGPLTRSAVCHFQAANGIAVDGEPSAETLAALGF